MERPGKVPAHANAVPNGICESCHVKADSTKAKQIDRTVGHLVHLRSAKQPGITCTQCHARPTIHVFAPSNGTCLQAGCHDEIRIRLGKMNRFRL